MQMLAKSVLTHNVNVSDQLDRCFELVFGLSDGSNALGQTSWRRTHAVPHQPTCRNILGVLCYPSRRGRSS